MGTRTATVAATIAATVAATVAPMVEGFANHHATDKACRGASRKSSTAAVAVTAAICDAKGESSAQYGAAFCRRSRRGPVVNWARAERVHPPWTMTVCPPGPCTYWPGMPPWTTTKSGSSRCPYDKQASSAHMMINKSSIDEKDEEEW